MKRKIRKKDRMVIKIFFNEIIFIKNKINLFLPKLDHRA